MKVKLTAVVPTVQYGNLQPEVEVEGETYELAFAEAERLIKQFWNRYVEAGKELPENNTVILQAFCGGKVGYDKIAHVYTNPDNPSERYLSGSQYGESFLKPFDKLGISQAMAKKTGDNPEDITKMWELKAQASRAFGTAVHSAMQLYEQYKPLSDRLAKQTHIHDNFVLKPIVEAFYASHKETAMSEVLVVDHKAKRAGQIDRLVILGEKHGRVEDFKTGIVGEKLTSYLEQCKFYSGILEADGWKMEQPVIHEWNGEWRSYANTSNEQSGRATAKVARQSNPTEARQVQSRLKHHHDKSPQLPKPVLHELQDSHAVPTGNQTRTVRPVPSVSNTTIPPHDSSGISANNGNK
jgi:hypothetical protein